LIREVTRVTTMVKVREIKAKSVLNKSKIYDYCLNPYTGCQVNCMYCYARLFMRRYSGHSEAWGEFVDAKINAPELLKKQLDKAKKGTVWVSSVCDPYQPLEVKYELTRDCLKELVKKQFPVTIQTKSKLVLRDLDIFREFEQIEVGFTITTDNERVAKVFEPGAASIKERLIALERIHSSGIKTYAFIGPLLPGNPEKLIEDVKEKVDNVYVDRMNYLYSVKGFYRQAGLQKGATDEFFNECKKRLAFELEKRKMKFKILY
jgi:DNA repair photolyase